MPHDDLAQRASTTDLTHRSFALESYEFRDNSETGGWTFEGVAAVVDHPYPVRDKFGTYTETIKSGAFDRTLNDQAANVALYVNHQSQQIALSNRSAGLQLAVTPDLHVRAELNPKRTDVQNVRYAIEDGILREMSIGFTPVKARDKWNADYTEVVRTQVALREVSIVDQGANTGGVLASMRSLDEFMASLQDIEMDEADVRRAIAALEQRLAPTSTDPFAERDRLARLRLGELTRNRPPLLV